MIKATPTKEISGDFKINDHAKKLHPDYQKMTIEKVVDHAGAEAKRSFSPPIPPHISEPDSTSASA